MQSYNFDSDYLSEGILRLLAIIWSQLVEYKYKQINQLNNQKMQSEGIKGRYIKQIKLAGSKQYFPNRYFSPYQFMDALNQAVRKKYEIKVVEVRYIISKSKSIKDMDDHTTFANLIIEPEFNNIFSIDDEFMKYLVKDVIQLVPPEDFDPNKFDEESNAAKKQLQQKKNDEIDEALKLLTDLYLLQIPKDWKGKQLRSLSRFKREILPYMKESEVDIFIKAVMSKPIEDRIENDKNSKSPIIVNTQGKQEVRVYLHPVKNDPQNQDLIAKLCPITDWSLCTFAPNLPSGSTYWSVGDIAKKTQQINGSIKIVNYIAIHKNKKGNMDYFQVYSFLFNEIVLKVVINLAQVKKVEIYDSKKGEKPTQQEFYEYYLHLAYPPRYYMSILKPDVGCDEGFIRTWERIQNFTFLRNTKIIMNDQFLRLYLFNNTIFKIRLCKNDFDINIENAKNLLNNTIAHFKGTIKTQICLNPYDFGRRLTNLTTIFKYSNFKNKFQYGLTQNFTMDKIWKLKYLILVEVRYNRILPSQIQNILNRIEQSREDIDIYIYIFWQNVALLSTVSPQGNRQDYLPFLQSQFNQIKKLSISDITRKVSSNTEIISYIFRASLTPSGYLYDPPTPQMKGRLMKEYSPQSEHFMRVTITDDNEGGLKNQKYITKVPLKSMMRKIPILERQYIPLGWSPSQLRSYSLWYIHQVSNNQLKRQQVLSFLGSFDEIQNPAKKAARIGQAFSSSWTYECKNKEIIEKQIPDDKSTKGYLYTDGIGKISASLLERISLKLHIKDLSVVQIRYKGAKGILVLDTKLTQKNIYLRPSMIKYKCTHDTAAKYLDILDWNKYKAGFLNRQTIVLLKSLGIADKVFQKKHEEHIIRLNNLSFKDCSIFKHMNQELNTDINNLQPANVTILHLLRAGFKLQNQPFFRGVLETMKKNGYHQLKVKCNIMIKQSARIIGIIDEWNILKEGELYCTIQDSLSLHPKKEHVQGPVIITRNPCLHPADIRKMICVSNQEVAERLQLQGQDSNLFLNYVNCVIFPKKGEIPVTSQISGSDLDGDNFFISWDPQLIPQNDEPCYVIDNPVSTTQNATSKKDVKKLTEEETYNQMLNFFVEYLNYEKLGQIDNSHLVHADRSPFYAKAKQCIQLAVAHGKAVDFPKSGFCPQIDPKLLVSTYPDFMQKQQSPEYISESIIGKLYRDIKLRITNLLSSCQTHKTGKIDDELIQQLIKKQNLVFESSEIREAISILLSYQKQLSGLITLVGVDTQYQIYSGNFSIAKDKVKAFGKNRLIATILTLRSKYFDQFFTNIRTQDKTVYVEATENNLQDFRLFADQTRRKALLFYACSYLMKYNKDQDFLNAEPFQILRKRILTQFEGMSHVQEGKFCGFVWFVIPKIMINQKYRIKKIANILLNNQVNNKDKDKDDPENVEKVELDDDQEAI